MERRKKKMRRRAKQIADSVTRSSSRHNQVTFLDSSFPINSATRLGSQADRTYGFMSAPAGRRGVDARAYNACIGAISKPFEKVGCEGRGREREIKGTRARLCDMVGVSGTGGGRGGPAGVDLEPTVLGSASV